ncbi:MAG: glycoside hydrolase family 97 N-terminal domain-containing protein, partial [Muribaculum sp.]|nr:glycoside hydrolase family 97 N-terminal domain-containing protein [Muribaculum sp.]
MKHIGFTLLLAVFAMAAPSVFARTATLESPDGAIVVSVSDAIGPMPSFSVAMDGNTLLNPSPLSLGIRGNKAASRIKEVEERKNLSEHIRSPFYRQKEFDVNYNSMVVTLDNGVAIEWRAFDDGLAYRYVTSMKDSI